MDLSPSRLSQVASSSLLKLGIEAEKDLKARESTYLLLDMVSAGAHVSTVLCGTVAAEMRFSTGESSRLLVSGHRKQ